MSAQVSWCMGGFGGVLKDLEYCVLYAIDNRSTDVHAARLVCYCRLEVKVALAVICPTISAAFQTQHNIAFLIETICM